MKHGFKLVIHKNLSPNEKQLAKDIFNIKFILTKGNYSCRHDSGAYFRRGILGWCPDGQQFTVRRVTKKRRIFAAVPLELLERKDGEPIELEQCICAIHKGGQRVKFKCGFNEIDYETFYEVGDIKG